MNNLFILIDLNNYFSRFYYSNPENCVERYLGMIQYILSTFSPGYFCNLIDAPQSFRKELYKDYKANRQEKPKDYYEKLKNLKYNLKKFGYPQQSSKSLEAEDLMNLFIENLPDYKFLLFSNDKDILQLESERVVIFNYLAKKVNDEYTLFEQRSFKNLEFESKEEYQLYHALKGDSSDNIPGVKGIGEKKAKKLAKIYKTFDNLKSLVSNDFIKDKDFVKIREDIGNFELSYSLILLFNEKYDFNLNKFKNEVE